MSSAQSWTCPQCSATSPLWSKASRTKVCPHCHTMVDLDKGLIIHREVRFFPKQSMFHIGREYDLSMVGGKGRWRLLGVLNLIEGREGGWDEGLFMNEQGACSWLSYEEGELYAFREVRPNSKSSLPTSGIEVRSREELTLNKRYFLDSEGTAFVRGARGEFLDLVKIKDRYQYWDGYDEDEEDALSVEWSLEDDQPTYSLGRWVDISRFTQANKLRSNPNNFGMLRLLLFFALSASLYLLLSDSSTLKFQTSISPAELLKDGGVVEGQSAPFYLVANEAFELEVVPPTTLMPAFIQLYLLPDQPLEQTATDPQVQSHSSSKDDISLHLGGAPKATLPAGAIELYSMPDLGHGPDRSVFKRLKEQYYETPLSSGTALQIRLAVHTPGRYRLHIRGLSKPYSEATTKLSLPKETLDIFLLRGVYDKRYLGGLSILLFILFLSPMTRRLFGWLDRQSEAN